MFGIGIMLIVRRKMTLPFFSFALVFLALVSVPEVELLLFFSLLIRSHMGVDTLLGRMHTTF